MSDNLYEGIVGYLMQARHDESKTLGDVADQLIAFINEQPVCRVCHGYGCDHCGGTGRESRTLGAEMDGYVDARTDRVHVSLDEPTPRDAPGTRAVLTVGLASVILRLPMTGEMLAQYAAEVERVRRFVAAEDSGDVDGVIEHSPVEVVGDVSEGQRAHIMRLLNERQAQLRSGAPTLAPTQEQRDNALLVEAQLARAGANVRALYATWTQQGMPPMPERLDPYNNPDDMTRWVAMMQSGIAPAWAETVIDEARYDHGQKQAMRERIKDLSVATTDTEDDDVIDTMRRLASEPAPAPAPPLLDAEVPHGPQDQAAGRARWQDRS